MSIHYTLHNAAQHVPAPAASTTNSERGQLLRELKDLLGQPRNFEDENGNPAFSEQSLQNARALMPKIDALDAAERELWDDTKAQIKAALGMEEPAPGA